MAGLSGAPRTVQYIQYLVLYGTLAPWTGRVGLDLSLSEPVTNETVLPGLGRVGVGSGAGKGQGEGRRTAQAGRGEECRDTMCYKSDAREVCRAWGRKRARVLPTGRALTCGVCTCTYVCIVSLYSSISRPLAPSAREFALYCTSYCTVPYGEPERVPPHGSSCAHSFCCGSEATILNFAARSQSGLALARQQDHGLPRSPMRTGER